MVRKDTGFTLVELSIVLVIVGLIVGGVVGGESLIRSARINAVASDFQKYKMAYRTFELQYDAIPGDMADAEDYWLGETSNGNGDGSHNANGWWAIETMRAWQHLNLSGIYINSLNGSYTSGTNKYTKDVNVPASALGDSSAVAFINYYYPDNRLILFDAAVAEHRSRTPAVSGQIAQMIDKKIDDGRYNKGSVTAYGNGDCKSSEGYNLSNAIDSKYCAVFYSLDK